MVTVSSVSDQHSLLPGNLLLVLETLNLEHVISHVLSIHP